jgi:hypothetical protein
VLSQGQAVTPDRIGLPRALSTPPRWIAENQRSVPTLSCLSLTQPHKLPKWPLKYLHLITMLILATCNYFLQNPSFLEAIFPDPMLDKIISFTLPKWHCFHGACCYDWRTAAPFSVTG